MKKLIFTLAFFFVLSFIHCTGYSNGVGVINANIGVYLKLQSSGVNISVESQIAVITSTQTFLNNLSTDTTMTFAFPLPEGASATGLRWKVNGVWYQAPISPTPQDSTLPGGSMNSNLKTYLGETPLIFPVPNRVKKDSVIVVELTYVELLPYKFGNVDFGYPNDYRLIQTSILDVQEMNFLLSSSRTIDSIKSLSSHPLTKLTNTGNIAHVRTFLTESPASENYGVRYSLNQTQLGLYDFSTNIADSLLPDTLGGFFVFIAEPDPGSTADVIDKVFTLIVDRSGSMSGNKIIQARNAANFIVNNLNEGDKFNVVDYSSNIRSFRNAHVPYTPQSRDSAVTYISSLIASGGTNISGAFDVAVPQFSTASDSSANIIIFLTDGHPTVGITNTNQLVTHVTDLIETTETRIFLYSFGIGPSVNQQLLTLMSAQNNGLAEFLGNDQLEERITDFYLKIRNPVLLNTQVTFSSNWVHEIYPDPLPNLYIGQQMLVTGRYLQPGPVTVTLSGQAFNQNVSYGYNLNLSDSAAGSYQFLTKIWAKQKIENLLIEYYSLDPNTPQAMALKQEIIDLSIAYGVISPFTSFGNPTGVPGEEGTEEEVNIPGNYKLLGNYPNPFNPSTTIKFGVGKNLFKIVNIKIYNSAGQLVKILSVNVTGKGVYEVKWDGTLADGIVAPSGLYFYIVDFGDEILSSKMILLK